MLLVLSWLIHNLLVLLSVAFFTLFERKVMGLFHLRIGPNKVSFIGLVQPLLDAFKLLTKQDIYPLRSNKLSYSLSPTASLVLSLLVWLSIPAYFNFFRLNYSLVLFFIIRSVIVLPVLFSGWSSNSKYSLIGSLRSIAQSVSYESVFRTLLIIIALCLISFSVQSHSLTSSALIFILLPSWVICTLAETHRAPFDFSEAESELVSGFNTEYSGAFFAFIFLSEYGVLLMSCGLIYLLFFGFRVTNPLIFTLATISISFIFIWVRITFCRFRYDFLIIIAWKTLLPSVLSLLIVEVFLYLYDLT